MNGTASALLAACALACGLQAGCGSTDVQTGLLDTSGVERFWVVQDQLAADGAADEDAWEAMFATPAYQWQADDEATRVRIRERMELAFQPDPGRLSAEIADAESYAAVRWPHYLRIREERQALARYLDELRSSDLIVDALAIVQTYLPEGLVQVRDWTMPVRLLFFGPDAFAGEDAIYVDLVEARDRGDELVLLLAHEFHHEYYQRLSSLPALEEDDELYWLLHTLRQLHQEGIADRIDKQVFPLPEGKVGMPGYVEAYNLHYGAAPEALAQFDVALRDMERAEERSELAREAWKLFHFGAHPEGYFMANTIAEARGPAALIEDVGDPFAFIRRFQSVRPLFSDEAMDFLAEVEADLRATVTPSSFH